MTVPEDPVGALAKEFRKQYLEWRRTRDVDIPQELLNIFARATRAYARELVPDELVSHPDEDLDDEYAAYDEGWNACRAEMLRRLGGEGPQ